MNSDSILNAIRTHMPYATPRHTTQTLACMERSSPLPFPTSDRSPLEIVQAIAINQHPPLHLLALHARVDELQHRLQPGRRGRDGCCRKLHLMFVS